MDAHIKLLGLLLNLIFGVALIVYIYQQGRRTGDKILSPLRTYAGAILTGILLSYLFLYLRINVPLQEILRNNIWNEALGFVAIYAILITASVSVILTGFRLLRLQVPSWLLLFCRVSVIITCLGIIGILTGSPATSLHRAADFLVENFGAVFFVGEITLLIWLFVRAKACSSERRKVTRSYTLLFGSRYVLLPVFVIAIPHLIRGFLFLVFFQGICFFWIRICYLPYRNRQETVRQTGELAAVLTRRYDLSPREEEIVQLMLQGKNNREIEDLLYISYNTVKNHIHTIYSKTGLQNRYQLFRFLENLRSR